MKPLGVLLFAMIPAVFPAFGQSVISARSGVVNYFEGDVILNGERLVRNYGAYPRVKEGSDLVTRSGRAEVLLAPSIYLRIGADSSIRMISDDLSDTHVELTGGSAIIDSTAPDSQTTPVTLIFKKDVEVRIAKQGQYRMDSDPPQFRVYQGGAKVTRDGSTVSLGPSQLFPLDGAPVVRKFTDGSDNLLDVWSDERHLLISSKIADASTIKDPLLDPDPDPNSVNGLDAYLGYLPLSVQTQSSGGLYGYGSTPAIYYNPYSPQYAPYGAYGTPYYGFFGLTPGLTPGYLPAYRFGTVTLSRPLSLTPGLTTIRSPLGTTIIRSPLGTTTVPRPGTPIMTRPGIGGRIGGGRR